MLTLQSFSVGAEGVCERESMGVVTINVDFNWWQRGGDSQASTFIVTDGFLLKEHYYHDGKGQTERCWEEKKEVMEAKRKQRGK